MRTNLASLVDTWRANGSQTAIVTYTGNRRSRTSYAELAAMADSVAAELVRRRIAPGERVVLCGQNSAAWVAAFFGCVLRGVLVVPLDAAGSPDFTARVLRETTPSLIIGDAALVAALEGQRMTFDDLAALPAAQTLAPVALTRETPLQILFTSGTTSEPKGIVHTHGNILASVEPIEREMARYLRYERWVHPLRFLHTLPLSHVFGQFMGLWLPPLLAAEVHFESRLEVERLAAILHDQRITLLAAVPRVLQLLRSYLLARWPALAQEIAAAGGQSVQRRIWRFRRVHRLLGWKFWAFVCGGASLPADLETFWGRLGFAVIQGYGMTETAALITLNHPFKLSRGSVGKALPGREVRIGPEGDVAVRGEMVSTATWQNGQITARADPWLETGDLARADASGNLFFVGRRSEVIVAPSGMNIHPEDVEAALLRQPAVSACAVVPFAVPGGSEPAAVLVAPAGMQSAAAAVVVANADLADFQRIRRWFLWPEPDLPRTSTGKVQRRKVAARLAAQLAARGNDSAAPGAQDAVTALIASVTGSPVTRTDDAARLAEDLHLDSLALIQVQSAFEERFGLILSDDAFFRMATLGDLRRVTLGGQGGQSEVDSLAPTTVPIRSFSYPLWPLAWPVNAIRALFLEGIVRPLVWFLLAPRVSAAPEIPARPMLLIANHATLFDAALILYALPFPMRRRVAIAAAGEMIDDWRYARNQGDWLLNALAPAKYWLLTALFNVFPLPRQAGFRASFAHIGDLLDRSYHVLIFPEGHRSATGELQPFRAGIGLLARESGAPILPVTIAGLPNLLAHGKWFHASNLAVRLGQPAAVASTGSAAEIAAKLEQQLRELLDQ